MDNPAPFLPTPTLLDLATNRDMIFVFNEQGELSERHILKPENLREEFLENIHSAKNIRELYAIPANQPLAGFPRGSSFPCLSASYPFINHQPFFAAFPFHSLSLHPLGDNRFAGTVRIKSLAPNFVGEQDTAVIYSDDQDRLMAFNRYFHSFFKETLPDPAQMLNRPVTEFLTPTPLNARKRTTTRIDVSTTESFIPIYQRDFRSESWNPAEMTSVSKDLVVVRNNSTGLRLCNTTGGLTHLTLPGRVSLDTEDFIATFDLSGLEKGSLAVFVSHSDLESEQPDSHGYVLGQAPDIRQLIIKRSHVMARTDFPDTAEGAFELSAGKIGSTFFIARRKEILVHWSDEDLFRDRPHHVSLGLRAGTEVRLLRAALYKGSAPPPEEPAQQIIETAGPLKRHFLATRFFNPQAQSDKLILHGFVLQGVDSLKRQLNAYEDKLERARQESLRLRALLDEEEKIGFLGSGPAMEALRRKISVMAGSRATILLQGDTGSGKEVAARYIHSRSLFKNGPFIKADCSSFPSELILSELFGHEKGAFTGAHARRIGYIERADKGTLFLDEIGNLNSATQRMLLQFLQDLTFTRIGGNTPITPNLRIIAASNVRLSEMVSKGTFREDLFYRLNVFALDLPLLKDRLEDLPELAGHFIRQFCAAQNKPKLGLARPALDKLLGHSWPGNVRELKNVIHRAVAFCAGTEISANEIELGLEKETPAERGRKKTYHALRGISRETIIGHIRANNGNLTRTAKALGVTVRALYFRLKRMSIDPAPFREA